MACFLFWHPLQAESHRLQLQKAEAAMQQQKAQAAEEARHHAAEVAAARSEQQQLRIQADDLTKVRRLVGGNAHDVMVHCVLPALDTWVGVDLCKAAALCVTAFAASFANILCSCFQTWPNHMHTLYAYRFGYVALSCS
jgi:hypothetical protein